MYKAKFKLQGLHESEATIAFNNSSIQINNSTIQPSQLKWDAPVTGTVYGTLLNYKGVLAALGDSVNESPYNGPPKAPILYIKPVNTVSGYGATIPLPPGIEKLEVGATLGIVIGKTATNVKADHAKEYIAGYTIVNDVTVPHQSIFRPAVLHRARDGFCPIGPWVIEKNAVKDPDNLSLRVYVNGKLVQENTTSNLIRSVSQLIEEVTDFMTLFVGDVLLVGVPENPPHVKAGDRIRIEIDQIGLLENVVVPESEMNIGSEVG
ncbi:MAG: fumarylacetoacetate hydrolase family protein [Paenisporosarcina sp.]